MKLMKKLTQVAGVVASLLWINPAHAVTVDLLLLYDDYTSQYFRGSPSTALRNWVDQTNSFYELSQVDIHLRVVGILPNNEAGHDMEEVLPNLRANPWVQKKRQELGADFVSQVHITGACGIGYVAVHREWAFNVVGPSCGARTLAHELGHNMGLHHSRRQGDTGGSRYTYALGHGVDYAFGTIMTYSSLFHGYALNVFSNPNLSCFGLPCGIHEGEVEQADAAKALNNVRHEIARFLPSPTEQTTSVNDNGGDDGNRSLADGVYLIRSKHSGRCVEVYASNAQDNARVAQWNCHGGNNQRWTFARLDDNFYEIKAKHSGKCLTPRGASVSDGSHLTQQPCNRQDSQQWKVIVNEDETIRLEGKSSGKVMDVAGFSMSNGGVLAQWGWVKGPNQRFTLHRVE